MTVARAVCPGCRRKIELEPQIERGEWVTCPHCQADLEVSSLNPPLLDWAYDGPEIAGNTWMWSLGTKWAKG
jgi:lysine biosynthesis protein LysW